MRKAICKFILRALLNSGIIVLHAFKVVFIFCARNDAKRLERFLQMYQMNCLQTGENVLLLTVFINIRDTSQEQDKDNIFSVAKNILKK